MTTTYNFDIEFQTEDDLDSNRLQKTVAQFVRRLSEEENIVSAKVNMEKGQDHSLSEDERERLLSVIERLNVTKENAARSIVDSLREDDSESSE
jgi:hypothetical protein